MKIEKVILQNIGVYVNRNEFDLKADKPVILIGGMNGRGKTTFLEAILLALYGRYSFRGPQDLEDYLRRLSNTTGTYTECFTEVTFSEDESGIPVQYSVKRYWDYEREHLTLKTQVKKNGEKDDALSESWDMFVEEILPRAIAPFFFFDGEKIAELAAAENDLHIQESIRSLLGVDTIEQLITDLRTVVASNRKLLKSSSNEKEADAIEQKIAEVKEELEKQEQELKAVQDVLDQLENKKHELEKEYTIAGGQYADSQRKFQLERQKIQQEVEKNRSQLLGLAASDLPLKMVESLFQEIRAQAAEEQKSQELGVFLHKFPELYDQFLAGDAWNEEIKKFYASVKSQFKNSPSMYHLDADTFDKLEHLPEVLQEQSDEAAALMTEIGKLQGKEEELANYLAVTIEDTQIKDVQQRMLENRYRMGEETAKYQMLTEQNLELSSKLANLEKERMALLKEMVKEQEEKDDTTRIIAYAQQQIELMEEYKLRLQAMKADELGEQMTKCFNTIIAKDGLIKNIAIDHATLQFRYYNKNGVQIDQRMLSSGEKQILVISMLWALGICSKMKFPLIIDTPLARLDSMHRASLIDNYFPKASEQVIILSTDQEITGQDYQALKKYIGKEFTLEYDEQTMSSSINEGYFKGMES